jgi:hypothetical protein
MKRILFTMLLLSMFTVAAFGQYTNVTVSQIQQVPLDSLRVADTLSGFSNNSAQPRWTLQTSPYLNDTVTLTALCVVPAGLITYTSGIWTMLLYDTAQVNQWGGVLVRVNPSNNDSVGVLADGFLNVAAGDIIRITGLIGEFPASRGFSATQFQPVPGHPIEIIGSAPLPKHIVKNVGDFYKGIFSSGKIQYSTGEPYEGMLVEFHNLTLDVKVNTFRGTFAAVDSVGNEISDYDYSHYFTLGHGSQVPWPGDTSWTRIYTGLGNGIRIDTLRGVIATSSGSEGPRGYRIAPLYPGDIVFGFVPPLITTHRRNPVIVPSDSLANISVKVTVQKGGSPIDSTMLNYSIANGPYTQTKMTYRASDSTYNAAIPMQPAGTLVRYFITTTDILSHSATLASSALTGAASDTSKGVFFYNVLDRPLTIRDVQYTPYVNGRSPYLGAVTSLSGIITADTAHIALTAANLGWTSAWYMQSSNQPWSGIWLTTSDITTQAQMAALRNGDSVTVTGTVQEQFEVTRLGNITSVTKVSSGNPEPAPVVTTTGTFNVGNGTASAEQYEGMLVRFVNPIITALHPTYSDSSEYSVDDGSGPVVVQQGGRNDFSNTPADSVYRKTILTENENLLSLTGIVYYSFNQYKFVPRTNADFGIPTGVNGEIRTIPSAYVLLQNYPNPFNPATILSYELPVVSHVKLVIYNILGQEVGTLVNTVQNAGRYAVRFDARSLASGVYFYHLEAGKFNQVKKMMVLK